MKNNAGNDVSDANGMKNIWRKYMVHIHCLLYGIEMWKKWSPNERCVTKPGGNLNRLKINIL